MISNGIGKGRITNLWIRDIIHENATICSYSGTWNILPTCDEAKCVLRHLLCKYDKGTLDSLLFTDNCDDNRKEVGIESIRSYIQNLSDTEFFNFYSAVKMVLADRQEKAIKEAKNAFIDMFQKLNPMAYVLNMMVEIYIPPTSNGNIKETVKTKPVG